MENSSLLQQLLKCGRNDAACLYANNVHPRLLLGPNDLSRLRRKTRSGDGKKIMRALREKARLFADEILADDRCIRRLGEAIFFWPKPQAAFAWALPDIALVGLLDSDERAIAAVRRVFQALPEVCPTLLESGLVSGNYYMPPTYIPYAYDLIAEELDETDRRNYTEWAAANHIRRVMEQRRSVYLKGAAHNMTLGGMELAWLTLLAIQGEPGAPDNLAAERDELLRWLEATLHTAIGPDGYPEEDIGYGTVVVPMLAQVVEALRRAGLYDVYRDCPRFAEFGRAMLHCVQPWGEYLSNTGDHGDQIKDRQFVLARLAAETKNPALVWLSGALTYTHARTFIADAVDDLEVELTLRPGFSVPVSWLSLVVLDELARPAHPRRLKSPTAFRDRGRGLVSFRSGWGSDDTFVIFDGSQRSPSAPGHYHDSCGHFSISALGEYFAVDTGRYNIEQNCHNVVLINGKSGRSTGGEWQSSCYHGLLTEYRPGKFVDFAAVDSSHQHNCYWARRYLGLVKGRGAPAYVWTVDDINNANDWAEFWWQLHTSPENVITIEDKRAVIRGWRHGNLLDAHIALPATDEYPKPHTVVWSRDEAVSSSFKYDSNPSKKVKEFVRPSDMLHGPVHARPRLIAKVAGYNGRFLALLIPRRKGEKPARVERLSSLPNSLAVKITFGAVEDTLIWAYEHNLLEADGLKLRGQWCVARRARNSRKEIARAIGSAERTP